MLSKIAMKLLGIGSKGEKSATPDADPVPHEFVPGNDLERALVQFKQGLMQKQDLRDPLFSSNLFVMYAGPQPEVKDGKLIPGAEFKLRQIRKDGQPMVAVFSSDGLVPHKPFMRINGQSLMLMIRGNHMLLNPGLSVEVAFSAAELEALLQNQDPA